MIILIYLRLLSLYYMLAGRCMAVDRKIAYFLFMCIEPYGLLLSFEFLWTSFCLSWGDSALPLAPLGCWSVSFGRLGSQGALLEITSESLAPLGPSGHLGLPSEGWSDSGSKMSVLFRNYLERL